MSLPTWVTSITLLDIKLLDRAATCLNIMGAASNLEQNIIK